MRLFAVAALAASLAACSNRPPGPEEVAAAFTRKWEAGDCTGIGALVTSDRGIISGGVEQTCTGRAALRKSPPREIAEVKVTNSREDGGRAVLRLETRYADGSIEAGGPLILVRQPDGSWRVDLLATGASRVRGLLTRDRSPAAPSPAPETQAAPGNIV